MADCDCIVGCKHPDHVDCGVQYCAMHEAAHALLEALEGLVVHHTATHRENCDWCTQARAAIAQAKGQHNGEA